MNKESSPIRNDSFGYSLAQFTALKSLRLWFLYKPFTHG